jgi:hypothetical protein
VDIGIDAGTGGGVGVGTGDGEGPPFWAAPGIGGMEPTACGLSDGANIESLELEAVLTRLGADTMGGETTTAASAPSFMSAALRFCCPTLFVLGRYLDGG